MHSHTRLWHSQMPSIKIHVDLPCFFGNHPEFFAAIGQAAVIQHQSSANLDLLRNMKQEITYLATTSAQTPEALHALAEPIAMQIVELKHPIQARIAQTSTLKITIFLGFGSFILSMLFHLLFMYQFHRYHTLHKFMPFTHLTSQNKTSQKITLQPTFHVPLEHISILQTDESFAWRDRCFQVPPPPATAPHFSRRTAFFRPFLQGALSLPF